MAVKRMTDICNDWAEWEGENPEAIADADAYVQSIDTAFAALESALRTSNHLDDGNGGCGAGKNPVWPCTCGRDAALALAEGVRS